MRINLNPWPGRLFLMSVLFLTACGGGGGAPAGGGTSTGGTTFTIGGSITGLTGQILLQNNGEGELALTENGTYTFSTQLANASSYSITVITQPAGQVCSILNAIGVIDSANSLNIIIACLDIDTDGDGLSDNDENNIHLTDPAVADTDGDGLDDFNEIVTKSFSASSNFVFNPLIADEPKLEIIIVSTPEITINYEFEDSSADTVVTERTDTTNTAETRTFGNSDTRGIEKTHTETLESSGEFGIDSSGPSAGLTVTASESNSTTNSSSKTVDFSASQTTENTTALAEAIGLETTKTVKSSSGSMLTTVRMKNDSNYAYVVEGLTLSAFTRDARNPYDVSSIGNLTFLDASNSAVFPPQTIAPGASSEILNFSLTISVDTAKSLMGDSPNIIVAPVVGRLTGNDEINFLLAATEVFNQTGLVSIDYGPFKATENYRVATYNGAGGEGISFDRLMNGILKVPFTSGEGLIVQGLNTKPTLSFNGITSVRDTAMDETKSGYWVVTHTHSTPNSIEPTTDVYNLILADYDLTTLVFNTRDVLSFIYIEDEDRDGLALRSELLNGTDPTKKDTDGDKLIDTTEVRGWFVEIEGVQVPYFSNPLDQNSDQDASPDGAEFQIGTNPEVADVQLPDTGITLNQCYQTGSDVLVACANENLQDGELGRDAIPGSSIDTDGKLGFSVTGVCGNGDRGGLGIICPAGYNRLQHQCAQDNVTGLIWHTPFPGFETISSANNVLVTVNNNKECGYEDWRIPSVEELLTIVNFGHSPSTIDPLALNKTTGFFISSTPLSRDSGLSVHVVGIGSSDNGSTGDFPVASTFELNLILVRGGN